MHKVPCIWGEVVVGVVVNMRFHLDFFVLFMFIVYFFSIRKFDANEQNQPWNNNNIKHEAVVVLNQCYVYLQYAGEYLHAYDFQLCLLTNCPFLVFLIVQMKCVVHFVFMQWIPNWPHTQNSSSTHNRTTNYIVFIWVLYYVTLYSAIYHLNKIFCANDKLTICEHRMRLDLWSALPQLLI